MQRCPKTAFLELIYCSRVPSITRLLKKLVGLGHIPLYAEAMRMKKPERHRCSWMAPIGGFSLRRHPVRDRAMLLLSWKINIPSTERLKVLRLLDGYNLNAYSLFQSEETLMETIAVRELDFSDRFSG
jgi:hypothetical protein